MQNLLSARPEPAGVSFQQFPHSNALALFAFKNTRERLGQQCIEPRSQHVHDYSLPATLPLDRLMWPLVVVAAVTFDDQRQAVLGDLLLRQRHALPPQRPVDFTFKNAAGVVLDLIASQVQVAEIGHAIARRQQRRDLGA